MKNSILLTGATGFLGGAIAVEAIRRGLADRLLLLARGDTPAQAHTRVIDNLKLLGASDNEMRQIGVRHIVCADLSELDGVAGDARLDDVSVAIHSAALATFSNHPSLEKINVDGTVALARLLHDRPAFSRFLYIGTAMACGEDAVRDDAIDELLDLPLDEASHLVPYTHSKALAEHRLREEFPDLPLVMVRPSIVVGHTVLGCAPSQSIFWVFLVAQMLGAFTIALDDHIDVIPVDWCAGAILDLACKERLASNVYHVSAGFESSVSFRDIDIALATARGVAPVGAAYEQFDVASLKALLPRMRECIPGCNDRLLLRALKLYGGFASLSYIFRNEHLRAEGIPASPPLTDYIGRCFESCRHIPVAEQMKWDFK
ncbi:MAG: SDR family oxidoreductase [Proteobacteria bacterium]|nr:SDR family oxidoreductase [Pseudomonadota bacterium]